LTQTEFELEQPLTPGGHTVFRTVHAPGYEGWTVSRYRQNTGPTPDWQPDGILRDMDRDGVDATVLFSNFALFATYTDDHEVALAHARVYNNWVAETYLPHSDRMRPLASIPTTDIGDAVKEVERCARLACGACSCPSTRSRSRLGVGPAGRKVEEDCLRAADRAVRRSLLRRDHRRRGGPGGHLGCRSCAEQADGEAMTAARYAPHSNSATSRS
jgi:hypothetical protein